MSFSRTKAVIDVMDICYPVKSVLVVIASHADENTGRCWPSIATIAGKSGLSQSTVKRALKAVRTSGLIKVHKKPMASGQTANYYLLPDEDQIRAEWPQRKTILNATYARARGSHGVSVTPGVVSEGPVGGVPVTHEHIKEQTNRTYQEGENKDSSSTYKDQESLYVNKGDRLKQRRRAVATISPQSNKLFGQFWEQYPRKEAKADAERAWIENECDAHQPRILDDLNLRKRDGTWNEPRYIPHAAKYLDGRRWEDKRSSARERAWL